MHHILESTFETFEPTAKKPTPFWKYFYNDQQISRGAMNETIVMLNIHAKRKQGVNFVSCTARWRQSKEVKEN